MLSPLCGRRLSERSTDPSSVVTCMFFAWSVGTAVISFHACLWPRGTGRESSESFLEYRSMFLSSRLAGMDTLSGRPAAGWLYQKLHPSPCAAQGPPRVGLGVPSSPSFLPTIRHAHFSEELWNPLHLHHGSNFSA